jgi:hypothetical protein
MRTKLFAALALCLFASLSAAGQEPAEGWSLRFTPFEGAPPKYFAVGDKGLVMGGLSVSALRRPNAEPATLGGVRFGSLNINVRRRGDRVVVRLWLTREVDEALDMVELGEYEVGVGEEQRISALERYGFEPVRLGLARSAPVKLSPPPVVNLTRSLAVLGVEVAEGTQLLEVTLKNESDRSVVLVELRMTKGGVVSEARPDWYGGGKPRALPGEVWKSMLRISGAPDKTSAEGHHFEPPDEIVVASVLFADGGYEGDVKSAAKWAALILGHRIQGARALAIVRDWTGQEGESLTDLAKEMRRKAEALPRATDDAVVDEFMAGFPHLPASERERLKWQVESGLKGVRTELLSGLRSFLKGGGTPLSPRQFTDWLTRLREGYERTHAVH